MQKYLAPRGVGQIRRRVRTARRRHDVEEGQGGDRSPTAAMPPHRRRQAKRRAPPRRWRSISSAASRSKGVFLRTAAQPSRRCPHECRVRIRATASSRVTGPRRGAGALVGSPSCRERRPAARRGLALRGTAHHAGHPALHRRAGARRGAARHPVRRHPGPERVEPPALPLHRPHRRAGGRARPSG